MPHFPRDPMDFRGRPAVAALGDNPTMDQMIEWFTEVGIIVLTDEDVIDKGDYVVPREVLPGHRYEVSEHHLLDMSRIFSTQDAVSAGDVAYYHSYKTVIYLSTATPRKRMIVEGTWRYQSDGDTYLRRARAVMGDNGKFVQRVMAVHEYSSRLVANSSPGSVKVGQDWVAVEGTAVPAKVRRVFAETMVNNMGPSMYNTYAKLLANLAANSAARLAGGPQMGIHYKGLYLAPSSRGTVKQLLSEFGDLVRQGVNGELDEDDLDPVIEALDRIGGYSSTLRDRCMSTWNTAVSSRNELSRAACGHIVRDLETHYTHDGYVCEECFEENYVHCEDTDEYHHRNHVYWHEDDDVYRTYEDAAAGNLYAGGHLSSWSSSTAELQHDKSFTPSQHGDFTMGIELEVEATRHRYERVQEAHAAFNGGSNKKLYAMFKADGSLNSEYGFEIVTAARRMVDHIAKFKAWQPKYLRSWDAGNCGMHVHIDSRAFTGLTLGKFLMFYNMPENMMFIRDIAGRHPTKDSGAANYARAISHSATENPVLAKDPDENESRYRMVNVTNLTGDEQERLGIEVERCSKGNYSTVEVRIFRGTLRKDRLLAQIEFAHASVAFCRVASWQELDGEAFKLWLSKTEGYPHLRRWFGAHRARNKNYTKAANLLPVAEEI